MRLQTALLITVLAVIFLAAGCTSAPENQQSESTVAPAITPTQDPGPAVSPAIPAPTVGSSATPSPIPAGTKIVSATAVVPTPTVSEATATPSATATPTPDATGAFFLNVESPSSDEVIVFEPVFDVVGRSTVDAFVSVNDSVAEIDADGRFVVPVELIEGPNVVEVVASNSDGDELSNVLLIIYEVG